MPSLAQPLEVPASPARDRVARTLMILLGVSTVGAFANAALHFGAIAPERVNIEAWRMFAYVVFAGLFTLLGLFPRRMPGLWELVFFQKAAVAVFLTFFVHGGAIGAYYADNASSITSVDFALAAVTLVCYVLARGWRAWLPQ